MRYAIAVEKSEDNYSAYVSDLPGCAATGLTLEETENEIRGQSSFILKDFRKMVWLSRNPSASLSILMLQPDKSSYGDGKG